MRPLVVTASAVLALVVATLPGPAYGQVPGIGIEITSGWSIPTGDFAEGPDGGWIYGIGATYRPLNRVDVYVGYTHVDHGSDTWRIPFGDDATGEVNRATDAFRLGARYVVPMTGFEPWIGGGLHVSQTAFTFSAEGESMRERLDRRAGWEVGGGAYIGLADRISLVPAARYSSHPLRRTDGQGFTYGDIDATYIALELGLRFAL
jgi:opacity protein-like surface antigen